jgi:NADP-dependent 3-hydroxy acid dehydrogenase YdfG
LVRWAGAKRREFWSGKTAIVTGVGSGIGAALCRALAGADARVLCTDVDDVVATTGRLDPMLNNAGITIGGDTELLILDQWNALIDVNIRGVVHEVAAAYPQMVRQGHGHTVNTASMAGLAAAGESPVT